MSQENVEIVRRLAEAYNRGDYETWLAAGPEDAEWVTVEEHPNARSLRGREGIAGYLRDWHETLRDLRHDIDELIDAGDSVACLGRVSGRPGEGAPEVTVVVASGTDFRDGAPVRTREFLDNAQALEAVGLRE